MIEFKHMLITIIVYGLIDILGDLLIVRKECKKIKYNCNECRNFKCYYHYCNKKRNELKNS